MKRINKKGFTLVELLVVLVILAIIMSIAIPSITSSVERSRQKERNSKIELIKSAAELYADRHKNTLSSSNITIKMLIDDGLLTKEEAKDPLNETQTICGYFPYSQGKLNDFVENNSYCVTID